ncbi:MAG: peroxiredoxin [Cyanobacteriota bacterium]
MTLLDRRSLLRSLGKAGLWGLGLSILPASVLSQARPANALGGTLPADDQPAPPFQLDGVAPSKGLLGATTPVTLSLQDFAGQWLVLYFYPRDFTGGCTLEARGFQRDLTQFQRLNTAIVGISADSPDKHSSFCESEGLAFPLLSDPGGQVSKRYGSWIPPFSQRHTFLIDPDGQLREHWVGVRPGSHSQDVLEAVKRRQAAGGTATV